MYSVMVVDDERVICAGIQQRIFAFNNPDIGEIYTAFSGKEALELAQKVKPNIIITDIKMPDMGGIELIHVLSKMNPHIKFIALSGYDDYEYIRSAFKNGVIDYLLKPVSTSELEHYLNLAIKKVEEEERQKNISQISSIEESDNDVQLKLRRFFLVPYTPSQETAEQFGLIENSFSFPYFAVGLLDLADSTENIPDFARINHQLETFKLRFFSDASLQVTCIDNLQYLLFVFNFLHSEYLSRICSFLQNFVHDLMDVSHSNLIASISTAEKGVHNLKRLYFQAQEAVRYKIVFNPGQIIEYYRIPANNRQFMLTKSDLKELENVISSHSLPQIYSLIDKYFDQEKLKGASIDNIKLLYDIVLKNFDSLMDSQQYTIIDDKDRNFDQFNTLNELVDYLKEYIRRIHELITQRQNNEKTIVDIAKKYIEDNFRKEINMAQISNMLSINYSYFSKLFKDQTGMTFTSYLTKLRMDEAKRLLSDPTNRITEISKQIGYDNTHNFSRAFKNYFGISPKHYRK